jgi:hypothetical protein
MSGNETYRKGTSRPSQAASSAGEGEGFLRRWSRRKSTRIPGEGDAKTHAGAMATQEACVGDPAVADLAALPEDEAGPGALEVPARHGESDAGETAPEAIDDADLPDVEELTAESDFTPFLQKGVSEQLQRRALRKLWLSDPVLANVDGLVDYGGDFTDSAMIVANLKTAYRVGSGMIRPLEEAGPDANEDEVRTGEDALADVSAGEGEGEPPDQIGPDEDPSGGPDATSDLSADETPDTPAGPDPDRDPAKST